MAGSFPTLASGGTVKYPLRVQYLCLTRLHRSVNAAEQRYVVRPPMVEFDLTFTNLRVADMEEIDTFFDAQKGAFDSSWTLAIAGVTYTDMRFMSDDIVWEETKVNRWTTKLTCRGFHPAISSPPATLPKLSTEAVTQTPWSKSRRYDTSYNDMETGARHATAFRAGGLTGFPSTAERIWEIRWSCATVAEIDPLIKFFLSKNGRYGSFDFTDPDTEVTYTGCRFESDTLDVKHSSFNNSSVTFKVVKI